MTITTRAGKGSALTHAELDSNMTDLNAGALATVEVAYTGTYTVPDGTGAVMLNPTTKRYSGTITLPLNPVNGQTLIIANVSAYALLAQTLAGNGKTIVGDSVITLPANSGGVLANNGAYALQYATSRGWFPVAFNPMFTEVPAGTSALVGYLPNGGGLNWKWDNGASCDVSLSPGLWKLQSTNSGVGGTGNPTRIRCQMDSTLDPSNVTANYGRYSYAGYQATMANSSIPFGAGATNDAPLEFILGLTPNAVGASGIIIAGITGASLCLGWKNAPLIFGHLTGGEHARFDTAGNFNTLKMLCDSSEQRDTGTAGFTVSNNVTNVILAGSGTVAVTFPSTPVNGQSLVVTLEAAYTAVTFAGNGKTIVTGAAMGVTAGSFAHYRYRAANTTWHRVG